jgi:hypothetical protein
LFYTKEVIGLNGEHRRDTDQRAQIRFVHIVCVMIVARLAKTQAPRDLGIAEPQLARAVFQTLP